MPSTSPRARRRTNRRRGRPSASDARAVREQLLSSARDLFLRYGYRAVSARQVAASAAVDPAMVQYYFRSKRGLYIEMIQTVVAPLRGLLERMLGGDGGDVDLERFVDLYMRTAAANPWLPALLIREVLPAEGALRDDFVDAVVRPMATRLRIAVERAQAAGRIDRTLRPEHVLVSALSLGMWPFLVQPVLKRALGIRLDGPELDALVAHTRRVLAAGVGARQ